MENKNIVGLNDLRTVIEDNLLVFLHVGGNDTFNENSLNKLSTLLDNLFTFKNKKETTFYKFTLNDVYQSNIRRKRKKYNLNIKEKMDKYPDDTILIGVKSGELINLLSSYKKINDLIFNRYGLEEWNYSKLINRCCRWNPLWLNEDKVKQFIDENKYNVEALAIYASTFCFQLFQDIIIYNERDALDYIETNIYKDKFKIQDIRKFIGNYSFENGRVAIIDNGRLRKYRKSDWEKLSEIFIENESEIE